MITIKISHSVYRLFQYKRQMYYTNAYKAFFIFIKL